MRKTLGLALFAGAALLSAAPAFAQDGGGRLYAGITGGTLGIGPEVGYRLNETVGVRASASFLGVSHEIDSDDVTYDGSFDLESYGAMVDVYPFGGGFPGVGRLPHQQQPRQGQCRADRRQFHLQRRRL